MKAIVVTAGQAFTDIDALACAVAYAELLKLEGKKAEPVLPGPLNYSVTSVVKTWGYELKSEPSEKEFSSVIVDASNLPNFAHFVTEDSIVEIYDHHYGFEDFWNQKLGQNSHIEMIGACATLIWEEFKKRGFAEKISETSARLLLTAIISNTLNFGAQITNQRDITAYGELRNYANLPDDWSSTYFSDQEKAVHTNVKEAIEGDTKVLTVPTLPFPLVIGQMELWDSGAFLMGHLDEIKEVLAGFGHEHWILTLPSIGEKKNYLYTENSEMQEVFSKIIGAKFENNIGTTDKLWLRKEIRKKLHEYK